MTELRGADNARARLRLNWRPRFASWRDGFAADLGMHAAPGCTAQLRIEEKPS